MIKPYYSSKTTPVTPSKICCKPRKDRMDRDKELGREIKVPRVRARIVEEVSHKCLAEEVAPLMARSPMARNK